MKKYISLCFILIYAFLLRFFNGEPLHLSAIKTWEAKFIPDIIETETSVFKIILAVNWTTKSEINQQQIKANCEVVPEFANFDCSPAVDDSMLNDTRWNIDKKELLFKSNFKVQQLTVKKLELIHNFTLEIGKIQCCLKEIDSENFQKVESSFVARLHPNLNRSNEVLEPEIDASSVYKNVWNNDESGSIFQVTFNSSPYIDHVYLQSPASLDNLSAFNVYKNKLSKTTQTILRNIKLVFGSPLRRFPLNLPDRYLTLPTVTLNGKCASASPVRYLVSRSSRCNYLINETSCSNRKSVFNSANYENKLFHIFTGNESMERLKLNINYLCLNLTVDCGLGNTSLVRHQSGINICENVVRKVNYVFGWFRGQLTYLNVTLTLTNVTLDESAYIFVDFLTTFDYDEQNQTLQNDRAKLLQIEGYALNQPIMFGKANTNESQVLVPYSYFLKSDKYGKCIESIEGQPINFGIDVYFGCKLKVEISSNIKDDVTRKICNVFSFSEMISKSGKANSNNLDDIIQVSKENVCKTSPTLISTKTQPKIWISAIILYDTSGEMEGVPFYQIRGMKIKSETNVECFECLKSSEIALNLAVEFIKTVNTTSNMKKFWLNQSKMPCQQDSCWTELAYPFTNVENDPTQLFSDHIAFTTRCACVLIFTAICISILLFFKLHYFILFL